MTPVMAPSDLPIYSAGVNYIKIIRGTDERIVFFDDDPVKALSEALDAQRRRCQVSVYRRPIYPREWAQIREIGE